MNNQILNEIKRLMPEEHLRDNGALLYSSVETICQGDYYIIGYNPGSDVDETLAANIENSYKNFDNAYVDEEWDNKKTKFQKGEAPFQKRIRHLMNELSIDITRVLATNLIFKRSISSQEVDYNLAFEYWKVHEFLFSKVAPKVIIAIGNGAKSSFGFIKGVYHAKQESFPANHGPYLIKYSKIKIENQETLLLGIPHLSRYDITTKFEVLSKIKQLIKTV